MKQESGNVRARLRAWLVPGADRSNRCTRPLVWDAHDEIKRHEAELEAAGQLLKDTVARLEGARDLCNVSFQDGGASMHASVYAECIEAVRKHITNIE
ncbi:hypothetical protein [Streptomyces sp. NPDC048565]|uniref:hypothetical protein n=1 Tax=Streptomyces sp. NPDC048565 TaxID=3155266 RepID=UPI003441614C